MTGEPGARVRKAPIVAMLAPRRELLTRWRGPGMRIGFEDMRPASLRKATTEPVKVTPPGGVSRAIWRSTICDEGGISSGWKAK